MEQQRSKYTVIQSRFTQTRNQSTNIYLIVRYYNILKCLPFFFDTPLSTFSYEINNGSP
jgi:hypothetical protein